MWTMAKSKSNALIVALSATIVALLVTSNLSYDPVNVSKLLLLSGFGFAIWALILSGGIQESFKDAKTLTLSILVFLFIGLISTLTSPMPFVQNFYGSFGRNTGYLAYVALSGLLLGSTLFKDRNHFIWLIRSVLIAGIINVVYCAIDIFGPDLIGWNNIYGNILGTFGNPNFVSAFLGIFLVMGLGYVLGNEINWKFRLIMIAVAVFTFYEIIGSNAVQGVVVTAAGTSVIGFFYVRSRFNKQIYTWVYSALVTIFGVFALAGALQAGPLAQYIYKASVSLRGVYWNAGIKMGLDNPLTGIGFDSYGDHYRTFRSAQAMITPGPQTVTNASHNVIIDIFSNGGFPLLVSYLSILIITALSILKVVKRSKKYDGIFVSLTTGWVCYQIQSIVSINQIGLAIWGWVLSGAIVAYEIFTREQEGEKQAESSSDKGRKTKIKTKRQGLAILVPTLGFAIGFFVSLPPFAADATWRTAVTSGNAESLYDAALKWPRDSYRMNSIASTLAQNGLDTQALEIIRESIQFNPKSFDAWRVFASIPSASEAEKANATEMMRKLDPRNTKLE